MDPDDKERSERYEFSGPPTSSYILILTVIALLGWAAYNYNYYSSETHVVQETIHREKRVVRDILVDPENPSQDVTAIATKEFLEESVVTTDLPDGLTYEKAYLTEVSPGNWFLMVGYQDYNGNYSVIRAVNKDPTAIGYFLIPDVPPEVIDDGKILKVDHTPMHAYVWINDERIVGIMYLGGMEKPGENPLINVRDFFVRIFPPTQKIGKPQHKAPNPAEVG